jgi:stage V sporulation protein B
VPFIYLEIVLESIIKGLGAQMFSSLNYLCEYVIRIAIVLICIPLMGFPGIVLSYYASNIAGNTARLIVVFRRTGMRFDTAGLLILPVFAAVLSVQLSRAVFLLLHIDPEGSLPAMLLFAMFCAAAYAGALHVTKKSPRQCTGEEKSVII